MEALQSLKDKLSLLLKKYAAEQAENKKLKATIAGQKQTIEALTKKVTDFESNMAGVHMGSALQTNESKEAMRKQLDNVIGEIDKILGTMND